MPDYEIRYFLADGTLALVSMTAQPSLQDATEHACRNLGAYMRFEVRPSGSTPTVE